jgi:DNA polymerase III gamma/tau subunit
VIDAAGGSYRDSETILEIILGSAEIVKDKKISIEEARSILGLADEKAVLDMMKSLIGSDSKSALATLEEVDKKGLSHQQFLRQLLELSRQMIRKSVEGKDFPEVGDYNMKSLLSIIKVLSEAGVQIKTSALPSLTFEVAILDICANDDDTQIKPKEKQSTRTGGEETEEEEELEEQVKEEKKQLESVAKKQEATKPKTDDFEKEIELEKVSEVWDKFLDQLRPQNQRLLGFLSKAEPSEIRGEELVLKVPFKFHKDRIENRESKKVISGVFKGLLNVALIPSCKIVTDMREVDEDDEDFDNSDLVEEIFGDMMEEEKL